VSITLDEPFVTFTLPQNVSNWIDVSEQLVEWIQSYIDAAPEAEDLVNKIGDLAEKATEVASGAPDEFSELDAFSLAKRVAAIAKMAIKLKKKLDELKK
jgi:hypothetical protein